jgi:hypothetical protein
MPHLQERLAQKSKLVSHVKSVDDKQKTFEWQICQTDFALTGKMNWNVKSVHEKQKPIKCQI